MRSGKMEKRRVSLSAASAPRGRAAPSFRLPDLGLRASDEEEHTIDSAVRARGCVRTFRNMATASVPWTWRRPRSWDFGEPSEAQLFEGSPVTGDRAVFERFVAAFERGFTPPVRVEKDPARGFVVCAAAPLPPHTILASYVGDVRRGDGQAAGGGDSRMLLVPATRGRGGSAFHVACATHCNWARFIEGIPDGAAGSANVQFVSCLVFGQPHVLVTVAGGAIGRGERLRVDYNSVGAGSLSGRASAAGAHFAPDDGRRTFDTSGFL